MAILRENERETGYQSVKTVSCKLKAMRRAQGMLMCLLLVQAFCLAQYQHVHFERAAGVVVHAHFFTLSPHASGATGEAIEDNDDDHRDARSVDTFQIVLVPDEIPLIPTEGQVVQPVASEVRLPAEFVHECAHDPPIGRRISPRAPPA